MRKVLWVLIGFLVPGMMFASAQWVQQGELTPSDPSFWMGWSVSASADGTTIAVGAPFDDDLSKGAVYVYVRAGSTWESRTQVAKLRASDATPGDELGFSVAVSADGSTIVAGSFAGALNSSGSGYDDAEYVFVRPSTGWANGVQRAKLTVRGLLEFGEGISGDGSAIVASADGASYLFIRPASGWKNSAQHVKLTASIGSLYGPASISLDGSTVAAAGSVAAFEGDAFIFTRPSKGWANETQAAVLRASDSSDSVFGDAFGSSIALSADGSVIAVAAPEATIAPYELYGAIYVFKKPAAGWVDGTETAKLTASDGTDLYFLGESMAMSATGSVIAAQVPVDDARSAGDFGFAYFFNEPPGGWQNANQPQYESAKLTGTSDQDFGEYFSFLDRNFSLTADGLTFVVGFPDKPPNFEGGAVVFSDAVQFSQFQARGQLVSGGCALNAGFVLNRESNGIDPVNEPVTLVIGRQVLAFPAGSFKQNGAGNYVFSGVVEGVAVNAQIKVLGSQMYQLLIEGHKANLTTKPLNVTLSIGDDTGTTLVNP